MAFKILSCRRVMDMSGERSCKSSFSASENKTKCMFGHSQRGTTSNLFRESLSSLLSSCCDSCLESRTQMFALWVKFFFQKCADFHDGNMKGRETKNSEQY